MKPRPWLAPLGAAFGAVVAARSALYRQGILARGRLRGPVISVGNLGVGGRGKTPVVAWLAAMLRDEGLPVAILSRGYRGSFAGDALVVSDGTTVRADAALAGDEPVMLAHELKGVVVAVGHRRFRVGQHVEERFGPRVHVLDDGFQHLALARDLDVLCLHPADLDDRLLPAGRLRESPTATRRADLILLGGAEEAILNEVKQRLGAERTFTFRRCPRGFFDRDGSPKPTPGRTFLVSGIAEPDRFEADVKAQGVDVAGHARFPDHHPYRADEMAGVVDQARAVGAVALVTTAKDAVRLPAVEGLAVLAFRISIGIDDEDRLRERVLAVARKART